MEKICLALISKRNNLKKYQVNNFFYKKQVYINWFI